MGMELTQTLIVTSTFRHIHILNKNSVPTSGITFSYDHDITKTSLKHYKINSKCVKCNTHVI